MESASNIAEQLSNQAFIHQLLHALEPESTDVSDSATSDSATISTYTATGLSRYGPDAEFRGIMVDTGAAKHSTAGIYQFQSVQRFQNLKGLTESQLDESIKGFVSVTFGIGETSSIGSSVLETPIGEVEFHIMPNELPFLLSLADMDRLKVYYNNITNYVVSQTRKVPVVRRYGHPFLLWDEHLNAFIAESFSNRTNCELTELELRQLHRRFGHPSALRLKNILERAEYSTVDRNVIDQITKYCEHCQRHGQAPHRFRFTLHDDDLRFNSSIIVDVFYINSKPVLHIVDEATRYQAGKWLKDMSARITWETLRSCWIDTYLGPPDRITTDAGTNFDSKEFKQLASTVNTKVKIVPVEAHNSIGIVERYHGPVRRAYEIIIEELKDHGISRDAALQMAFKAINDSVGPDGLVPTLLVYGAFPRMTEYDPPSPSIAERATAIKKAIDEVQKQRAKRQVQDALRTRNGPNTTAIHDLKLNSDVLVWRDTKAGQKGHWDGPFRLISKEGEDCVVQ
jgi:hypothetical protein